MRAKSLVYAMGIVLLLTFATICCGGIGLVAGDLDVLNEKTSYTWSCYLKVYDPARHEYVLYWTATQYLKILEIESKDSIVDLRVAYSTQYDVINIAKYTDIDTENRTVSHRDGNYKASFNLSENKYVFEFVKESWGFKIDFPISPFTIFNVKEEGFEEFFYNTYILWHLSENETMDRGLFFDTWDIILGSRRRVYYVELYYSVVDLNLGEEIGSEGLPKTGILEMNAEIDQVMGIVIKLRYFWKFADKMFEIILELVDTNSKYFIKNSFIYLLVALFFALIVLGAAIRMIKARRRKRLIRI